MEADLAATNEKAETTLPVATGAADQGGLPAATGAADQGGHDKDVDAEVASNVDSQFGVGDFVVISSKKFKAKYDGRKGKVLAVLTNSVKLEVLDGPSSGETVKRPFSALELVTKASDATTGSQDSQQSAILSLLAAGGGKAAVADAQAGDDSAWGDVGEIFGDVQDVQ